MSSYINFITESGISLGVLTLVYFFFLRKETFLMLNRIFLVLSAVFSTVLPMLNFTFTSGKRGVIKESQVAYNEFSNLLETVTVTGNNVNQWIEFWVQTIGVIGVVYFAGVVFMALRLAWRLGQLGYLVKSGSVEHYNGIRYLRLGYELSPFSFLNWLFVGRGFDPASSGGQRIMEHELQHIRQFHSIDVLTMEVISIFQWFNPFIWIMNRLVRENHEFLADRHVLNGGFSSARYKLLLLEQATGIHLQVANNFNQSILKKRIKMMTKIKSTKWAMLKLLAGTFAFALLSFVFACETEPESVLEPQKAETEIKSDLYKNTIIIVDGKRITKEEFVKLDPSSFKSINIFKDESSIKQYSAQVGENAAGIEGVVVVGYQAEGEVKSAKFDPTVNETVFKIVERMPQFQGGDLALRKFIAKNIKYPEVAQMNGIQGKVYVNFIVNSEGYVCKAKILRGVDPDLDNEALRVVNSSPKWTPGYQRGKAVNVGYTVPIEFMLQ